MKKLLTILILVIAILAVLGPIAKANKTSVSANAEICYWPIENYICGFGQGSGCVEANDMNVGCGYTMPDGNCCTVLIMPGAAAIAQLQGQDFVIAKGHGCRDSAEHYYRIPINQIHQVSAFDIWKMRK